MSTSLHVLLLEDSETDAKLIKRELQRAGLQPVIRRVDSEQSFAESLTEFRPDVVLSDHSLADFDARGAISVVRKFSPTTPVIIVTAEISPRMAVAAIRAGAEEVVLKSQLAPLAQAITDAVNVRRPLRRLSRRQIEVLRLVAEGNRTRDIAERLKLSAKTVERHRGEVMKRLGIHDLVGLVRYAVRVGLIAANGGSPS